MKKSLNRYFVSALSSLLILSNFSFATELMFCEMNNDNTVCSCSQSDDKYSEDVTISKEKNKCCTEETSELSNSNILLSFRTELPQDINTFGTVFVNNAFDLSLHNVNLNRFITTDKSRLCYPDIPVLNSSLLI